MATATWKKMRVNVHKGKDVSKLEISKHVQGRLTRFSSSLRKKNKYGANLLYMKIVPCSEDVNKLKLNHTCNMTSRSGCSFLKHDCGHEFICRSQ